MNATRLTGSAPSLRRQPPPAPHGPPAGHVLLEVCTENVEGVRLSARGGADAAELCDNLAAGGTTPSIGSVEAAILACAEEVAERRAVAGRNWVDTPAGAPFRLKIMIRPRGGSFVFTLDEGRAMTADVRRIAALIRELGDYTRPRRSAGARPSVPAMVEVGFVMGVLTDKQVIDRGLLRLLVDMADGAPVTFNKAIDATRDPVEAYGDLGGLGVASVLTSGGAPTALEGARTLRGLVEADGPTIIAAGQVRPDELEEIVTRTGVTEVHMRCSRPDCAPQTPQRTDLDQVRRAVGAAHALPVPS